ncbi:MAG: O-antigen ligase family protein [Patescibacteria group bacterium]
MQKLTAWFKNWGLPFFTLFLLAFIPLYPKLPLFDIKNTWVYVRVEDFVVLFVLLFWGILTVRHKLSLKTPLTLPILLFWAIGLIATLHGLLLVFPDLANVFPNVAFLSFLRRLEYMSLFFIAYQAAKDKQFFSPLIVTLTLTLLVVAVYGIGQKYLGLPAFLTMNEEFAKGFPIRLSPLSRVSATFGGHYDLAAYLVLTLPILVSLVFGYRRGRVRFGLIVTSILGLLVLFMTVSRISFFALFVALALVLFFQQKKLVIFSLPFVVLGIVLFLSFSPNLLARFGSTIKEIDVLVDAKTGYSIGHVKEVPKTYFENKIVKQQFSRSITDLYGFASPSAILVVPYTLLPERVVLLTEPSAPTGEDLPQGTGYINLLLSPITKRLGNFFYEPQLKSATSAAEVFIINGDYLVKKAFAYDLSFTTRFQGEWPNALAAFKRNVLFGSGYGSVSLAVDNSYLRMLAEVGALGFISFLAIFVVIGIYLRKALSNAPSRPVKSLVFGYIGGLVGLAINALFIDVFEASKIAFILWLLTGVVLGILHPYHQVLFDFYKELKRVATSTYAVSVYLLIAAVLLFSPLTRNYFVGDDFTWFRWAAECGSAGSKGCAPDAATILNYFTQAQGFFYRPGTKTYFLSMYRVFWLNQNVYHLVSLFLHYVVSVLVLILAKKIFRNLLPAALCAFLFLALSGFSEAVFWISATGFLFTALFTLLSLISYISWVEKKKTIFFIATLIFFTLSLLFHELGVVTPLLFLLYQWTIVGEPINLRSLWSNIHYRLLFLPIPIYIAVRYYAQSHWASGDYNYNLLKLPFNAPGNAIGYLWLTLAGPAALPFYETLRNVLREQVFVAIAAAALVFWLGVRLWRKLVVLVAKNDLKILLFGAGFALIALLPFLGLGNIASRYGYLASIGFIYLIVFLIEKLYKYLLTSGRDIAIAGTIVAVGIFGLWQIVQLRQIHGDWYGAGEKTRRFFVAIESVYDDYWTATPVEFHLVNVPIRQGAAWIFPVGIPDALWFVFRNPSIKVYSWPTLESAFAAVAYDSKTQRVFVFDTDGKVMEMKKPPPAVQ